MDSTDITRIINQGASTEEEEEIKQWIENLVDDDVIAELSTTDES